MKHLIIIGAGGMGRTMYDMARESVGYGIEYDIQGFLDDNIAALDNFENYPPIIAPIQGYLPNENEIFICSIGGTARKKCIEEIISRGGQFLTMIHSTALVSLETLGMVTLLLRWVNTGRVTYTALKL